jgi:hypothetical protein
MDGSLVSVVAIANVILVLSQVKNHGGDWDSLNCCRLYSSVTLSFHFSDDNNTLDIDPSQVEAIVSFMRSACSFRFGMDPWRFGQFRGAETASCSCAPQTIMLLSVNVLTPFLL